MAIIIVIIITVLFITKGAAVLQSHILDYANHFKRFYSRMFQPLAQRYALTQLEIDVLLFLHNNPQYNTARDIVEKRGVAKSNVSAAVEALREKGYLTSGPDPQNRKVQRLSLAPESRVALSELAARQERCFVVLFAGFGDNELKELRQLLQRLDQNVQAALRGMDALRADFQTDQKE